MNIFSYLIFIDHSISQNLVHYRTDFLDKFFMSVTWLGSWPVITLLSIIVAIIFFYSKKRNLILPFLLAVAGAGILTVIIKYLVDRARPGANLALYLEKLPSFPSAHASLTLALFGFLIYAVSKSRLNLVGKVLLIIFFVLIIAVIGFSRLYLGVHYFSDVLGGYLVGLPFVIVAAYLSHRKFL